MRVLSDTQSLSCLCSADRRRQKNVSLPVSSCFSLIGIRGTQSRPECLLHVPRRNVGNEGMEREEEEMSEAPLHLMLCGPKNSQHPPFFSTPSASLFPYAASLPGSPSLFSSHPCPLFLLVCLFRLSKHALWCPMIRLLKCNARQFGHR